MAEVTALRGARGGGERFRLYLDGELFGIVSQRLVTAYALAVGGVLTETELGALRRAAAEEEVMRRLLGLLERRDYSRWELTRKLAKLDQGMVAAAIAALAARGLIDDARYARALVEVRQQSKPSGRARLAHDLRRRGIAPELIKEALSGIDRDADLAAARIVARKAGARLRGYDALTRRRRLAGALGRRGFAADIISRVMREETGGDGENDD